MILKLYIENIKIEETITTQVQDIRNNNYMNINYKKQLYEKSVLNKKKKFFKKR
jgi:hypothetical protein